MRWSSDPWELKKETIPMRWEVFPLSLDSPYGPEEGFVAEEGAVLNGPVDQKPVRIDSPTGADVEMTGLGVPYGPPGKAHRFSRGFQGGERISLLQIVHHRRTRPGDEVAISLWPVSPPVQEDKEDSISPFPLLRRFLEQKTPAGHS
jgi:hypothetical protein